MQGVHTVAGMASGLGNDGAASERIISTVSAAFDCVHEPVTYPFTMLLLTAERTCVRKLSCELHRSNTEAYKQVQLRIVSMGLNISSVAAGCLLS